MFLSKPSIVIWLFIVLSIFSGKLIFHIPIVIVMDQASIHTSNAIYFKRQEWQQRGITLFELPTYSPHLNLIEHLWKFMKYHWSEFSAYSCWNSLVEYVERVEGIWG